MFCYQGKKKRKINTNMSWMKSRFGDLVSKLPFFLLYEWNDWSRERKVGWRGRARIEMLQIMFLFCFWDPPIFVGPCRILYFIPKRSFHSKYSNKLQATLFKRPLFFIGVLCWISKKYAVEGNLAILFSPQT